MSTHPPRTLTGNPVVRIDLAVPADVRFGAGRVSEVPAALAALGASRVLVVTGRTTARADAVRSALTEAGISSIAFGVATEPSIERVRAGVALVAEAGCDAVLGFGGGSALDVGKAVAMLATYAIEVVGTQEYRFDGTFLTRFEDAYGVTAAAQIAPHLNQLRL